jgi:hypothetical protein
MPTTRRQILGFASACLLLGTPAFAQDAPQRPPSVRPEDGTRRLVEEAARRSPAIQEWIDQLDELDVTVYVRQRRFTQIDLDGRISLLSKVGSRRYLIIELACGRSEITQMATLGHELFHAIEIATEPAVVNSTSLANLYSRIGIKTGDSAGVRTFETEGAAAAGQLARRQLLTSTTRHGNGT